MAIGLNSVWLLMIISTPYATRVLSANGGFGVRFGLYASIHHVVITSGELGKRPPKLNGSQNILIIGSDSRKGIHGYGRGIGGSRSDTSMLLHIPPTSSDFPLCLNNLSAALRDRYHHTGALVDVHRSIALAH